jgi:hypothetical protein
MTAGENTKKEQKGEKRRKTEKKREKRDNQQYIGCNSNFFELLSGRKKTTLRDSWLALIMAEC